jgi:predicted phosphodiesterase
MPAPKTAARLNAEKLCEKYPEHSNLGLAKKLRQDYPESFASVDNARAIVRVIRGAYGAKARKRATQPRPKGKAGQKPQMPPSLAEPWTPFELGSGIRVGSISDVHIPYHHVTALSAAVSDLKRRKIDVLLINGDFADFYRVSRWQKDPAKRKLSEERLLVIQGLEWLRYEFGQRVRIVYKLGNHEERWNHFVWNQCPEIYDLPQMQIDSLLEFEKHGIELVEDQRPVLAGKLPIFHGHELPKGLTNPVNQARGAFLRTNDSTLTAHGHQTSSQPHPTWDKKEAFSWSQGCLCEMHPEFSRINKWNLGHAFIDVSNDGSYDVTNMRITESGQIRSS